MLRCAAAVVVELAQLWLLPQARVADTIDFKLLERLPTKNPDSLRELLHEVEQPVDRRLGELGCLSSCCCWCRPLDSRLLPLLPPLLVLLPPCCCSALESCIHWSAMPTCQLVLQPAT